MESELDELIRQAKGIADALNALRELPVAESRKPLMDALAGITARIKQIAPQAR